MTYTESLVFIAYLDRLPRLASRDFMRELARVEAWIVLGLRDDAGAARFVSALESVSAAVAEWRREGVA